MRVLIINSNRERSPWPVPPTGACAVASSAARAGHEVRFLDLCFARKPEAAITATVQSFQPQAIGISVRNIDNVDWQAPQFYLPQVNRDVIDPCRAVARCPIVVGGPAAGIMPAELLQYFGVDFVIGGDGEIAFAQLLEAIQGARQLAHVAGLTWRDGQEIRTNPPTHVENLDELPSPEPCRWLDIRRYLAYNGSLGIQTKRGCPLTCTYCSYIRIEGTCYRFKSPARVADEAEQAIAHGVRSIEFVDSTFNIPLPHAVAVCQELIARKVQASFSSMTINPAAVPEDFLSLLRRTHFTEVAMTPETASPAILHSLGKNFDVPTLIEAARAARKARMPVLWYFMFGGPGETEQTVRETLAFIEEHIPSTHLVLLVSGIRIFPGSRLEAIARAQGQLAPADDLFQPVWYQPPLARQRLFALLDQAQLQHPNYLALQDHKVPQALLRAAMAVHRFFRCRRPVWQYLRDLRRIQTALGLPRHLLAGGKVFP